MGLLVGVAVGLAAGAIGDGAGEEHAAERVKVADENSAALGREKTGRRAGSASGLEPVERVRDYLVACAKRKDGRWSNQLELARCEELIANMTEHEVLDLMGTQFDFDEEDGWTTHHHLYSRLFARLAELNGPEAMRMVLEDELAPFDRTFYGRRWLLGPGIAAWVAADPVGAERWFRSGEKWPEFFDRVAQESFFKAMTRMNRERALELLCGQDGEIPKGAAAELARYEKTTEGLQELLAHARGPSRLGVFQEVVLRDVNLARDWLDGQPGLEDRGSYVETLARELMKGDLESGVAWYMEQELDDTMQSIRYSTIVDAMIHGDAKGASAWLSQQPDSPLRDRAEKVLALRLRNYLGSAAAFRWANELSDARDRREVVSELFHWGWDRREHTMSEVVAKAAREAGMGGELEAYTAWRLGRDSQ